MADLRSENSKNMTDVACGTNKNGRIYPAIAREELRFI